VDFLNLRLNQGTKSVASEKRRKGTTVVSEVGKEAVVAILGPGDFFGEGCLACQPVRMTQ
jgi:hypothetical protein